jgi:hypothetical protein
MMALTVFYSWQSDRPKRLNQDFIEAALKGALEQINAPSEVFKPLREEVVLDRDTLDLPGTPEIVKAIFDKIDGCDVFVPDLTFVAVTDAGRLTSNPNVLIEYGWARHSARGLERIVPVMNAAFGGPGERAKNLPFDMSHVTHPLLYTLREDSSDADRSAAQRGLTRELAKAIRTVLESAPIEAAAGPEFEAVPPTYDKAVFFQHGEVLARRDDQAYSVPLEGPKMFLRLIPTASTTEEISPTKALKMAREGSLLPFRSVGVVSGTHYDRNKHGALAFTDEAGIVECSQLLYDRELWGINCRLRDCQVRNEKYLPVGFEATFASNLGDYLRFARDKLELRVPLRFIAGITGAKGLCIAVPPEQRSPYTSEFVGETIEPDVEFDGRIDDWNISPLEALTPFFEKVWDAFGLERSNFANWWQPYHSQA